MTTVYAQTDSLGKILTIFSADQPDMALTPRDDQDEDVAKFLRDPLGLEDSFPALKKWQLWLAALEVEPPIAKADVLAAVNGMPGMSFKDRETVRIMIEDAQEYAREDPRIDLLATAMGIPPDQMDTLWRWAAEIQPV